MRRRFAGNPPFCSARASRVPLLSEAARVASPHLAPPLYFDPLTFSHRSELREPPVTASSPSSPRTCKSYRVLVGMEIHVQLATRSKMFTAAPNGFGGEPNS